jgi:glycosyltransferase involved in cell wall biosynthesis
MKMDSFSKTKRKKIIFFTDTTAIGGAEEYLKTLAICLNDEFDVRIAIPENKDTKDFVNELKSKGIRVDYIKKGNIINNFLYFRKNNPDIIHFNLPYPTKCITAILTGMIHAKSKLYVTEQLVPTEYKPHLFLKLIKKITYAKLDTAITVSNKSKDALVKNFNLPKNKIKVIYNCVDIDYIKNYNEDIIRELKNKFSISDSALVFGTVGRLDRQKGHEYLINASINVIKNVPNSLFLFVGDGSLRNQLVQKMKDNNINEYFRLVGYQKNIPAFLASIDIFVLPSISEGLPFSILEAMAAKKPVIATNVGGVSEIITNNSNGLLVEPMDPDDLARAMIMLAQDARKRNFFAEMGYKKVIENFSLDKMILTTKEIYR